MKKILIIIFLFTACSLKEEPNYNPFDDQFNISVNSLIKDGCDTISAGCGYFNFRVSEGRVRPYYQVFDDDWHKVVAKGFDFRIDSFIDNSKNIKGFDYRYRDSIWNLPLPIKEMNKELQPFSSSIIDHQMEFVLLINDLNQDTLNAYLGCEQNDESRFWVRTLNYHKDCDE